MARWIPFFSLVALIDPNADNLARGAEGYVEGNGETGTGCGADVRGEPAEEGGDTGECTAGGDYEAAVAVLKLELSICVLRIGMVYRGCLLGMHRREGRRRLGSPLLRWRRRWPNGGRGCRIENQ
jgi:hypothetical protein